ncbi:hypothetical protein COLO4_18245 [Corchorus olitorius]|uniref:Peptidase M16 n=1 Tax=Corchorus olitorius TaxID=93759 RepID=A0A1R3JA15_9ROSI|nr:hypothetical protein COLO4_18245 [Corchorus olitorius]
MGLVPADDSETTGEQKMGLGSADNSETTGEQKMGLVSEDKSKTTGEQSFRSLEILKLDMDKEFDKQPFGVDYGKLENGLVYYVKCNSKPKQRAALALAVKVGSVLEEEDERGVAHIVEHLAFSATKKYNANHNIVKFLESIGAKFGPCQNASTCCDETIYELLVPIDKPELLSEAIEILAEFSSEIRFAEEDLEKERGAVMEEYREDRDADGRIYDDYWTLVFQGSKSVIELIKTHFGHKHSALDPPPIPQFPVPSHEDPRFSYFVEPEASESAVCINYTIPVDELKTMKDYRDMLVRVLFRGALNQRFYKISCRKDPPYFSCSISGGILVRGSKVYTIDSTCKENGSLKALESMLTEVARVRLHGFTEREISVARDIYMSSSESEYMERDQVKSTDLRDSYAQVPEEIVDSKPNAGNIVQQLEHENIEATELILSNGMRVCYKCTDLSKDQVLFKGFSYGGLSELPESMYFSTSMGSRIAREIGVFGYKPTVLMDMLAGKRVNVDIAVTPYKRTFYGDCSPFHLETALQLVYKLFTTNVTPDDEVIERVMKEKEDEILSRERDPYSPFFDRASEINSGKSYFFRALTRSDFQKVNPLKACEYFNSCFKDPSTFTLVIVGNIDPTTAVPLILQYLGGIQKPPKPIFNLNGDCIKGLPYEFPKTTIREIVWSPMKEEQCMVRISFPIDLKKGAMEEEINHAHFLSQLLETKLRQLLRFKHGKIYHLSVSKCVYDDLPCLTRDIHGVIRIKFSCDPKVSLKLVGLALNEISRLRDDLEEGPSDEDVKSLVEISQRSHEKRVENNSYWLNCIVSSYQSRIYSGDVGASFKILGGAHSRIKKSLTPSTMQLALQRLIPPKNLHTVVILMPQTSWFEKLRSFPQWNSFGIDSKVLAAIAGLTVLALGLHRYSQKSQRNRLRLSDH